MKINLIFDSQEELQEYIFKECKENIEKHQKLLKNLHLNFLEYLYSKQVYLLFTQWEWCWEFFTLKNTVNINYTGRECGRTTFFIYLIAYLLKNDKKVLYVSLLENGVQKFLKKLMNFETITEKNHENLYFACQDNYEKFKNIKFDYIFLDDCPDETFNKIKREIPIGRIFSLH